MLADAIDRLLVDPGLRDRLARAARETIETRFTLDRTSHELFDLFKRLERDRHEGMRFVAGAASPGATL